MLGYPLVPWKEFCKQGKSYAVKIIKGHEQVEKKLKMKQGVGMALAEKVMKQDIEM